MRFCRRWLGIIFALVSAGCVGRVSEKSSPVLLQSIDAAGLKREIARFRGRVVLVDFWATWCGPCVELFPHTMELYRRYGDRGLAVITVSLDGPDNASSVRRFLAEQGRATRHFLASYDVGAEAFTAFEIDGGALPCLRLYDQHGKLRKTFSAAAASGVEVEAIEHAIEELLGVAPAAD